MEVTVLDTLDIKDSSMIKGVDVALNRQIGGNSGCQFIERIGVSLVQLDESKIPATNLRCA